MSNGQAKSSWPNSPQPFLGMRISHGHQECPAGFTLIETMAVIVMLGILATAVMVSLAGPNRTSSLDSVIDHLASADALVRDAAQQSGKAVTFKFDDTTGKMVRIEESGKITTVYELPADFSLSETRTAATNHGGPVVCSRLGITPTYAVAIQPKNGEPQWIIFSGLTGDMRRAQDAKEVDAIFKVLAPPDDPVFSQRNDVD